MTVNNTETIAKLREANAKLEEELEKYTTVGIYSIYYEYTLLLFIILSLFFFDVLQDEESAPTDSANGILIIKIIICCITLNHVKGM